MICYVLDSDVLIAFERAKQQAPLQALGKLPVIVTDSVWAELTSNALAQGRPKAEVANTEKLLQRIAGAPTMIAPQSPQALSYQAIYDPHARMDQGESTVIAYALHDPDSVAVLMDKTPLHRAIEELKGRTLSLHGFMDMLVRLHGLPKNAAKATSSDRCRRTNQRPPTWW